MSIKPPTDRAADRSRFDGKVAIVTGSTQGLGEAIASLLVSRGLQGLVVTGRNADRGRAMVKKAQAAGTEAIFVGADLSKPD